MSIDVNEIEKSLLVVYQKNLRFLKENFFDIYQDVEKLSTDIADGSYVEKYSIEIHNGYMDILNLENNGYYYSKNSYTDAEERTKYVDFSINNSIDLLRKVGSSNILAKPIELKDVIPVVDFINKNVDLENIVFQKIMKFMYIGVGLGFHLQEIDKKIQSYNTLIIEPELEIFRLSLFTTDYSIFEHKNRKLFLNIGMEKVKRDKKLIEFSNYHEYMNYNIKYYNLLSNLDYIKDEVIDFFGAHFILSFPYKSVIENIRRTMSFIKNKDNFIDVRELSQNNETKNKKALLISAGPSLDSYIEFIKKHQDKFVIASVDVIVRKLEKHGIIPDIVFSIDPSPLCKTYLETEDPKYLKNSAIVLLSQQHEDVMKLLRERELNYYLLQSSKILEDIGFLGSSQNVGTYTFQTMVHFKFTELFIIGNDAAFNQETGARYSEDSSYEQTEDVNIEMEDNSTISKEDVIEVKGNLRDTVKTNRSLLDFKNNYHLAFAFLKAHYEYKAYNLSDGVFMDGLEPLTQDNLLSMIKDNDVVDFNSTNYFDQVSTVIENIDYKDDIKIINNIISRARKVQKMKILNKDQFLQNKLEMMIWILEKTKQLSSAMYCDIFLQYSSAIDSYINFCINLEQKGLYTRKNLEELNKYWSQGVISVFKEIKDSIS